MIRADLSIHQTIFWKRILQNNARCICHRLCFDCGFTSRGKYFFSSVPPSYVTFQGLLNWHGALLWPSTHLVRCFLELQIIKTASRELRLAQRTQDSKNYCKPWLCFCWKLACFRSSDNWEAPPLFKTPCTHEDRCYFSIYFYEESSQNKEIKEHYQCIK